MFQITFFFSVFLLGYGLAIIDGIYKVKKNNNLLKNTTVTSIFFKSLNLKFISKFLNTSSKEERKELLKNFIISQNGIFIVTKKSSRINPQEILFVATSLSVITTLFIPRISSIQQEETQQVIEHNFDHSTTYNLKF
ncbi:MAG: hypothetical protein RSB17_01485 [Cetobacterium sp.]